MKIYLKRDKTDENSRYIVYSHNGDELYKIIGKHTRSSQYFYVMRGEDCLAKIKDTYLALLRSCHITTKNGSFHLAITTPKDKIMVAYHGVSLHLRGDILNKSYDILDIENTVVACVSRRFATSYDALEINFNEDKYEILSIATAICLDCLCTTDAMAMQAT